MKKLAKLFFVFTLVGISGNAFSQIEKGAKIEFKKEIHDYGNIKFEADAVTTFEFTNTGTEPLVIANAKPSCGCTIPEWPKEPIAPGDKGFITVKYNATNKEGGFAKSITIVSNAVNEPTKSLRIKGTVLAAPQKAVPTNTNGPVK